MLNEQLSMNFEKSFKIDKDGEILFQKGNLTFIEFEIEKS